MSIISERAPMGVSRPTTIDFVAMNTEELTPTPPWISSCAPRTVAESTVRLALGEGVGLPVAADGAPIADDDCSSRLHEHDGEPPEVAASSYHHALVTKPSSDCAAHDLVGQAAYCEGHVAYSTSSASYDPPDGHGPRFSLSAHARAPARCRSLPTSLRATGSIRKLCKPCWTMKVARIRRP